MSGSGQQQGGGGIIVIGHHGVQVPIPDHVFRAMHESIADSNPVHYENLKQVLNAPNE